MQIRAVDAIAIRIPGAGDQEYRTWSDAYILPGHTGRSIYPRAHETCLVRVEADNGLVGWGEAQSPVGARATQAIVADVCAPMLIGECPLRIGALWYRLYSAMRERGHVTGFYVDALAGIDIALHDLVGHALGVPVWQLLRGGFRDSIPVYTGVSAGAPEVLAQRIQALQEMYAAFKIHTREPDETVRDLVMAARHTLPADARLLLDVHGSRDVSGAIHLCELLQDQDLYWLESPCLAEDVHGHAEIRRRVRTRIATGEWLRTVWEWRSFIDHRACDVAMPDIARTGFTEGMRIAALCDAASLQVSPHIGGGGIIATAATVHYAACLPHCILMEHSHQAHAQKARIATVYPSPRQGAFALPQAPGLGIEIDEARLDQYSLSSQ